MMNMSADRDQFDAAVRLIRGLPKSGPFQPSNEMKLRLYGFYKQALDGPCQQPAPGFWDVVGKAKWAAWKSLGDMSPQLAMRNYVAEIRQVIDTMSLTDDVVAMMDTLGPLYGTITDTNTTADLTDNGEGCSSAVAASIPPAANAAQPRGVLAAPRHNGITSGKHVRFRTPSVSAECSTAGHTRCGQTMADSSSAVIGCNGGGGGGGGGGVAATVLSDTDTDDEFIDTVEEPIQCSAISHSIEATHCKVQLIQHRVDHILLQISRAANQLTQNAACGAGKDHNSTTDNSVTIANNNNQMCTDNLSCDVMAALKEMRRDIGAINAKLDLLSGNLLPQARAANSSKLSQVARVLRRYWWWRPLSAKSTLHWLSLLLLLVLTASATTTLSLRRRRV